jgi:hypothetical protein
VGHVRKEALEGRQVTQASDRLRKVLEIGDVEGLFPVLKDWPAEELQALLKDVEDYALFADAAIDRAWEATAFRPDVFLDSAASKFVDYIRDEARVELIAATSEICSVASFYLGQRGAKRE